MKKIQKIIIFTIIFFMAIGCAVNADMGPKPSITIKLKNMKTANYTIDLLTKDVEYSEEILPEYAQYSNSKTYQYNEDGWVATKMRNSILWGDIEGNSEYTHTFNYFGTPSKFKVIIEYKDGTVLVSDIIERTEFNYDITLDVNTMKISKTNSFNWLWGILLHIILTLVIEIIIALIMKIRDLKVIVGVNLLTQVIFHVVVWVMSKVGMFAIYCNYFIVYAIMELFICTIEYLLYRKFLKTTEKNKILLYTVVANIISGFGSLFYLLLKV